MPEERQSKNERREAAREAARVAREKQKKRETRTRVLLIGGSTVAVLAVIAIVALVLTSTAKPVGNGPANMASGGIVLTGSSSGITAVTTPATTSNQAPTPTNTTSLNRPINIVTYVDYLCPFCQQFETANATAIKQLVTAGVASLEVHPVILLDSRSAGTHYSARAANMMACVANYQPNIFLDVQTQLFAQQPAEGTSGLDNPTLISLAQGAGATFPELANCVNNGDYRTWISADYQRVLADTSLVNPANGSFGTPTVLVNGKLYTGAPSDAAAFSAFIQSAYASTSGGATATPTPTATP